MSSEKVNGKRMVVMLGVNGDHLYRWPGDFWTYEEPPTNHDGSEPPFPWIDNMTVLQMIKLKAVKKINNDTYKLVR